MGGILSNEERVARGLPPHSNISQNINNTALPGRHVQGYRDKRHRNREPKGTIADGGKSPVEVERCISRPRSQSLGAILEEIYFSESETDIGKATLIPRAKLSISRCSESRDSTLSRNKGSSRDIRNIHWGIERKILDKNKNKLRPSVSLPFLEGDEWFDETMTEVERSPSPSFDHCPKQVEDNTLPRGSGPQVQTPHKIDEMSLRSSTLPRSRVVKRQMTPTDDVILPPDECTFEENDETHAAVDEEVKLNQQQNEQEVEEKTQEKNSIIIIEPKEDHKIADEDSEQKGVSQAWYSNLKEQFERLDREMGARSAKTPGCRIAGATLKSNQETLITEEKEGPPRKHYFSQLVRSNKSLIDEELPDPDKVQNIRAMFQEQNCRLGGSLQNISTFKNSEPKPERPKSAQSTRPDDRRCQTPDGNRLLNINKTKPAKTEKLAKDNSHTQPEKSILRTRPARWTDSGSMSSGVSSDLSSCETDLESWCKDIEHPSFSSDDEVDVTEKHYIQAEIMDKIRAFGTSVTYFGGKMIRCSVGPLLSPTTQAILEEIGQKTPSGNLATRTFDEFYIKYKEANKKPKVGRTRSFGQGECNVFTDNEIREHRTELETTLGIRYPRGAQAMELQHHPKKKRVSKSYSSDNYLIPERPKPIDIITKFEKMQEEKRNDGVVDRANKPLFDFDRRITPPKIDMEFEEFEVCESLHDKLQKMEENNNNNNNSNNAEKKISLSAIDNATTLNLMESPGDKEGTKYSTADLLKTFSLDEVRKNEQAQGKAIKKSDKETRSDEHEGNGHVGNEKESENSIEIEKNEKNKQKNSIEDDNLRNDIMTEHVKKTAAEDWKTCNGIISTNDETTISFTQKRSSFEEMVKDRRNSIDNLLKNAKRNSCDRNIMCDEEKTKINGEQEKEGTNEKLLSNENGVQHSCCHEIDYKEDIIKKNTRGKRGSKDKVMLDEFKEKIENKCEKEEEEKKNFKVTIKIEPNNEEPSKVEEEKFEEIVFREQEPLDSLEFYLPTSKPIPTPEECHIADSTISNDTSEVEGYKRRFQKNGERTTPSRWPVETTVVIDIQKNENSAPKVISHGKAIVKTTRRLF